MSRFFFIVFSLIIVSGLVTGCKQLQPVTISTIVHDTTTITDTAYIAFPDELTLNELALCDSSRNIYFRKFIDNKHIIDSLKLKAAKLITIHKISREIRHDSIFLPGKEIIKEKIVAKPLTTFQKFQINGFWFLSILFLSSVILLVLLIKFKK